MRKPGVVRMLLCLSLPPGAGDVVAVDRGQQDSDSEMV